MIEFIEALKKMPSDLMYDRSRLLYNKTVAK